jgi:hypothetical protein
MCEVVVGLSLVRFLGAWYRGDTTRSVVAALSLWGGD